MPIGTAHVTSATSSGHVRYGGDQYHFNPSDRKNDFRSGDTVSFTKQPNYRATDVRKCNGCSALRDREITFNAEQTAVALNAIAFASPDEAEDLLNTFLEQAIQNSSAGGVITKTNLTKALGQK